MSARRVDLMGIAFDSVTEAGLLERVGSAMRAGRGGHVITPNLDILRQAVRRPDVRGIVERADLVVADGLPLVWASRLRGDPLPGRVAGSDLVWSLPAVATRHGRSLLLVGGNPGDADLAAERLRERHPDLEVAGTVCPPMGFERDPAQVDAVVAAVDAARPGLVLVGLSFPKQAHLIERLRDAHPDAWYMGVGIAFAFVAGTVPRAPRWMQRSGLEWTHRLAQEPRRLARRYLIDDLPFGLALLAWAARRRTWRR
jgi:N-acetylglucosaminyldiphosphoundecaprenol N-acetyl-beta-D-mannosaminyltransferase